MRLSDPPESSALYDCHLDSNRLVEIGSLVSSRSGMVALWLRTLDRVSASVEILEKRDGIER